MFPSAILITALALIGSVAALPLQNSCAPPTATITTTVTVGVPSTTVPTTLPTTLPTTIPGGPPPTKSGGQPTTPSSAGPGGDHSTKPPITLTITVTPGGSGPTSLPPTAGNVTVTVTVTSPPTAVPTIIAAPPPSTSAAPPTSTAVGSSGGSCNSGPVQCCNSVQKGDHQDVTAITALLGIPSIGEDTMVGLTCSPITAIGVGASGSCSSNTVCCENNSYNGLINIGCVPINLTL